jgi:hypothetical protein
MKKAMHRWTNTTWSLIYVESEKGKLRSREENDGREWCLWAGNLEKFKCYKTSLK